MKIIDITPTLSSRIAVWPGDVGFQREIAVDFRQGGNMVLSSITSTVHVGAHADAPNHYHPDGCGIAARDVELYVGPCEVVHVVLPRGEQIFPKHIKGKTLKTTRVLFRTNSFPNPEVFNEDFNSFSPKMIRFLAEQGVQLVGIDTPSVDPFSAKELLSHQEIYAFDMAILEGLVLSEVAEACYTLVAPPLKMEGLDASPVRALLLPA